MYTPFVEGKFASRRGVVEEALGYTIFIFERSVSRKRERERERFYFG